MAKGTKIGELFFDMRAGIQSLQKDLAQGKAAIKQFEGQVKSVFGGLAKIAVLGGAVLSVKKFGDALSDLARKGDVAGDIADNFKALGGASTAIDSARKAVLGTVSAFDLMKIANQGLIRGIPQFNEKFGQLTEFAKRFSEATGRDTVEVLEGLTSALAKGKAKGLEPFGFALAATGSKAENQLSVFAQLESRINSLAPATDSVAEAQEALTVSMNDAWAKMGIGVNANQNLTNAYRDLQKEIDETDFKQVGRDLAEIYTVFMQIAQIALPAVIKGIKEFSNGLEFLNQDTLRSNIAAAGMEIDGIAEKLKELDKPQANRSKLKDWMFGTPEEQKKELETRQSYLQQIYNKGIEQLKVTKQKEEIVEAESLKKSAELRKKIEEEQAAASEKAAKDAAAKKSQAAIDAFNKEIESFDTKKLTDRLDESIKGGQNSGFSQTLAEFKTQYTQNIIDAHKDALASGVSMDAVKKFAEESAQYEADQYVEKMAEAETKRLEDQRRKQEEAHKESVEVWRSLFENAITGVTFDLESALKQVAVGFAAEMAQAVFGSLGGVGIGSAQDFGGLIAQQIFGSMGLTSPGAAAGGGGVAGSLLQSLGVGVGAGGLLGSMGGGAGVLLSTGEVIAAGSAVPAGATAVGSAAMPATGVMGAVGPALPYIAAAVAAYYVADHFGAFESGPTNPETLARHEFAGWLEEEAKKLKSIAFFDNTGTLKTQNASNFNFVEGDFGRFDSGEWVKEMDSWGDKAKTTFLGLGEALRHVQGITEDVGGQIGFLLGENLSGNIDNARLLVQQLGLDFKTMEDALVQAGLKGDMSWHEVEVNLQGVAEAFKPGLAAMGDFAGAWDAFANSAGRGQAALKGARDIAVEALESGAKTLEDAKQALIASGKDEGQVNAFFAALESRGIKTLEQLRDAEDRVVGGIVADTESNSATLAEQWHKMAEELENVTKAFDELPDEKKIKLKWESEFDSNTQAAIDSGLTNQTGISIPAEANSEVSAATTPPKTSRAMTSSGKIGGVTLNMDLRGAGPGVGAEVNRVITQMEDRIVSKAVNATAAAMRRGGSTSRGLGA